MIQELYNRYKASKKRKAEAKAREEAEDRALKRELISQDLIISKANVLYIINAIKTHESVSKTARGDSAGDTKKIREAHKKRIEWLKSKLIEEIGNVKHFEDKMLIT